MKNKVLYTLVLLSATLVLLDACKKNDKEEADLINTYNRSALLTNTANNYIVPAYSEYLSSLKKVETTFSTFTTSSTTTNLAALKIAYSAAVINWQKVAFLEFGPAEDISLRAQSNVFPVDTSLINNNINSGSYQLAQASNFSAKGLQSLDYLFYNPTVNSEAELVVYLTNSKVKKYVTDVLADLISNADYVATAWSSYKTTFIANNASNADGSAMSMMVNSLSIHYETYVRKGKLGLPAGVFNGFSQQAMPEHVEAYYSGNSLTYLETALESMDNFIKGVSYSGNADGEGIEDYLIFVQAKKDDLPLATQIQVQFKAIGDELDQLNNPLSSDVQSNSTQVKKAYEEMQKMVSLIKVDLTAALGVLINYQDTDGD